MSPDAVKPSTPPFTRRAAIFLDVDGTLLEFASRPQDISLPPGLVDMLAVLQRRLPVALVSGRRLEDLDRLFAPLVLPMAGQHGAERRAATGRALRSDVAQAPLTAAARQLQRWALAHPGALVEDKSMSVALHYRRAPELAAAAAEVTANIAAALGAAFTIVAGNMVYEIRPSNCDKGRAIAAFLTEAPFTGCVPVFVGDDATDEDGFAYVNSVGGHSIRVGGGPTLARYRIETVTEVLAWLAHYAAWLEGRGDAVEV